MRAEPTPLCVSATTGTICGSKAKNLSRERIINILISATFHVFANHSVAVIDDCWFPALRRYGAGHFSHKY